MPEPRKAFEQHLEAIEAKVIMLFGMVEEDLGLARRALEAGNADQVTVLSERDREVDHLYREVEHVVQREILLQAPVASDLRYLLSVVRVTPELERSHDLIVQLAGYAGTVARAELSPAGLEVMTGMGDLASRMWRTAADSWFQRDRNAATSLAESDEEMDDLHARLYAELAAGGTTPNATVQLTLVGRCLVRLGAHAVNIARRVEYLAGPPRESPRPG